MRPPAHIPWKGPELLPQLENEFEFVYFCGILHDNLNVDANE
jgi:hypothetical protein